MSDTIKVIPVGMIARIRDPKTGEPISESVPLYVEADYEPGLPTSPIDIRTFAREMAGKVREMRQDTKEAGA
jgi:hypothetical protein